MVKINKVLKVVGEVTKSLIMIGLIAFAVFAWSTQVLATTVAFDFGQPSFKTDDIYYVYPDTVIKALVENASGSGAYKTFSILDTNWNVVYSRVETMSSPFWFTYPTMGSLALSPRQYEFRVESEGLHTQRVILTGNTYSFGLPNHKTGDHYCVEPTTQVSVLVENAPGGGAYKTFSILDTTNWNVIYSRVETMSSPFWFTYPTLGSLGATAGIDYDFRVDIATVGMIRRLVTLNEPGYAIPSVKKTIGWATNVIWPSELRTHIAEMEAEFPIDGLVISVYPDDWPAGEEKNRHALWFGGRNYTLTDFTQARADLQATTYTKFTNNFIDFGTTVQRPTGTLNPGQGNIDWFDPAWSGIVDNARVVAQIAKDAGFKGLFMDVEAYDGNTNLWRQPFNYRLYNALCVEQGLTPRTFDECTAQVRQRGREFMQALTGVYPTITIVIIPNAGWEDTPAMRLMPHFVAGMLEGNNGMAMIVDGGEHAYPYFTYSIFSDLRNIAVTKGAEKSPVPTLYSQSMRYGFGTWVDYRVDSTYRPWQNYPNYFEKNYRTPPWSEHTFYHALNASDNYAWIFSWNFWNFFKPGTIRLHGHYLDAMRNSRESHTTGWTKPQINQYESRIREGAPFVTVVYTPADLVAGTNILQNGGFETWSQGPNNPPDGWALQGSSVNRESVVIKEGLYSAKFIVSQKSAVVLTQTIPVGSLAGKTILFGVWVKQGSGEAIPQITDHVREDREENVILTSYEEDQIGWIYKCAKKTIRAGASGNIEFTLKGELSSASNIIYLDAAKAIQQ